MTMKLKPQVLIANGDSWYNRGDWAVLAGTIKFLQQHFAEAHISILTDLPDITARQFPEWTCVHRKNPISVWRGIRNADAVVWGGGELIQTISSQSFLAYQLFLVLLARLAGKPVIGLALGVGEIRNALLQRLLTATLESLAFLSVRDECAKRALISLGVRRPIEILPDPALHLSIPPKLMEKKAGFSRNGYAVVAPRAWFFYSHTLLPLSILRVVPASFRERMEKVETSLVEIADYLVDRHRLSVRLLPMYPGQLHQDIAVCELIQKRMRHPEQAEILSADPPSVEGIVEILADAVLVVSIRLHPIILGVCGGTPGICLYYQPKGKGFMELMNTSEISFDINNLSLEKVLPAIDTIIANRADWTIRLTRQRETLIRRWRMALPVFECILHGDRLRHHG